MANISSYPLITPKASDLILFTETYDINAANPVKGNPTRLATLSDVLELVPGSALGYKSYTALITQSSTNAPVATVLADNITGTMIWSRSSSGVYVVTASSAVFTANKTWMITGLQNSGTTMPVVRNSDTQITITTSANDDRITNSSFEIRVYE